MHSKIFLIGKILLFSIIATSAYAFNSSCPNPYPESKLSNDWTINVTISSIALSFVQLFGIIGNIFADRWTYHKSHSEEVVKLQKDLTRLRKLHRQERVLGTKAAIDVLDNIAAYINGDTSVIRDDEQMVALLDFIVLVLEGSATDNDAHMEEEETE